MILAPLVLLAMQGPVGVAAPRSGQVQPRLAVQPLARFNRAEEYAIGVGALMRAAPSLTVAARVRLSTAAKNVWGALELRRDGLRRLWSVTALHEIVDSDPLAPGLDVGNSLTALLLAHDDGRYLAATGIEAAVRGTGAERQLAVSLRVADEASPRALARSEVNDALGGSGVFPPNDAIVSGVFGVLTARLDKGEADRRFALGGEARAGEAAHARAWVSGFRRVEIGAGLDLTVRGWAGAGVGDDIGQGRFRLGGLRSLRGYPAGALSGRSAAGFGLDLGAAHRVIAPVVFVDAGVVGGGTTIGRTSAGTGVSVLRGRFRVQAARPLQSGHDWRFDFLLRADR